MRHILTATLFLATAAGAQPAPGGDGMGDARARLVASDANKDGKWDKAEWLAGGRRERGFVFLDADKDGFVTQAELRDGVMKMQSLRGTPE